MYDISKGMLTLGRTPTMLRTPLLLGLLLTLGTAPTLRADDLAFPYDDWASVLERFVDQQGFVDYEGLAQDPGTLNEIIAHIEVVSPDSHPERFATVYDELAYFLNAYNALIFNGILDRGVDIVSPWGKSGSGIGFFVGRKMIVGGRKIHFKKYEDDWVRARFEDPRVHAVLNCASISCPRLPREPFLPETLDEQLDAAMREFVGDPRHVAPDPANGTLRLSKIFDWFTKDFRAYEKAQGNADPSLVDYINRYRDADAQIEGNLKVRYLPYDKGLNRQP